MLKGVSRECINSELPAEITEKNTHHKICVEEYIVLPYQKYMCNWAIFLEYVYYHIVVEGLQLDFEFLRVCIMFMGFSCLFFHFDL
jgi:hypothetical protein